MAAGFSNGGLGMTCGMRWRCSLKMSALLVIERLISNAGRVWAGGAKHQLLAESSLSSCQPVQQRQCLLLQPALSPRTLCGGSGPGSGVGQHHVPCGVRWCRPSAPPSRLGRGADVSAGIGGQGADKC